MSTYSKDEECGILNTIRIILSFHSVRCALCWTPPFIAVIPFLDYTLTNFFDSTSLDSDVVFGILAKAFVIAVSLMVTLIYGAARTVFENMPPSTTTGTRFTLRTLAGICATLITILLVLIYFNQTSFTVMMLLSSAISLLSGIGFLFIAILAYGIAFSVPADNPKVKETFISMTLWNLVPHLDEK